MADAPSWLTEEDTVETPNPATKNSSTSSSNKKAAATAVAAVASNPKAQKYAAAAAADKGSKWISGDDDEPVTKPKDVEKGKVDRDEPEDFEMDPAELKDMQKYHLILRVAYILAAIIMGVTAGVSLINQTDLGKIFFAFYVMFFVSLICCFECGLNVSAT